jgi:hypothetical protein
MKNRYENALILTCVMIVSFAILLIVDIYMEQPKKLPCSSYIDTRYEGYHVPMCIRE